MSDSINIRPYQTGDARGISEFMHRCFVGDAPYENRAHSAEYYAWRYAQNPAGKPVVYVAEEAGRIVGLMAVVAKRLWLNGREAFAAESGDTFMDPACKGKNVFMKIAARVFDAVHDAGMEVIYGAPNPVSYDVVVKLFGYEELFQYRSWIRPIHFASIVRTKIGFPILPTLIGKPVEWIHSTLYSVSAKHAGMTLSQVFEADERFDAIWNRHCGSLQYAVIKDGKYVDWRFIQSPEEFKVFLIRKNDASVGYVVFKPISIGNLVCVHVADLFCPSERDNPALWKAILIAAKALDADFVNTWMKMDVRSIQALKRNGFVRRKKPFWLVMRGERRSVSSFPGIKDARNWVFSQADTDNI